MPYTNAPHNTLDPRPVPNHTTTQTLPYTSYPAAPPVAGFIPSEAHEDKEGAVGYVLMWLLGIPIPILLIFFLIGGCS